MRRIALFATLAAGCTAGDSYQTFELEPALPKPLDVLVVLDDTTAMASHLPRNPPPGQITVFAAYYNGAPDIHVAVTTSTTNGVLRRSSQVPGGVIEFRRDFTDGSIATNFQGELIDAIASLMNVESSSMQPNAVLASATTALESGFLRDDAAVAIVISTAGDDASSGEARTYADAILALGHVTGVTIIHADAVARLGAFIDSFGARKMTPMNEYYMGAIDALAGLVYQQPPLTCLPIPHSALVTCLRRTSTSCARCHRAIPRSTR
jgi:hypothetical protein